MVEAGRRWSSQEGGAHFAEQPTPVLPLLNVWNSEDVFWINGPPYPPSFDGSRVLILGWLLNTHRTNKQGNNNRTQNSYLVIHNLDMVQYIFFNDTRDCNPRALQIPFLRKNIILVTMDWLVQINFLNISLVPQGFSMSGTYLYSLSTLFSVEPGISTSLCLPMKFEDNSIRNYV